MLNYVALKGNLTRDPELKKVGDTHVANFTVASNRKFTRQNGDKDQEVTYVDCEVWDSAAERLAEYCGKGTPILLEGALKLDTWESEGGKRSKLKVRVKSFEKLHRSSQQSAAPQEGEKVPMGDDDPEIPF